MEIGVKKTEFQEKKIIHLEGLTCANCANKIETRVRDLEGVKTANLNLMNQTINLSILSNQSKDILAKIKRIVAQLEPHVKVYESNKNHGHSHEHGLTNTSMRKKEFLKIGISGLLFILAMLLDIDITLKFFIFFTSYLIVGGEVILRAGRNILRGQVFDENFLMTIATFGAFLLREFPEAVGVMIFYQVGELFQSLAVDKSRRSIQALLEIKPEYANIEQDGKLMQVEPECVKVGEIIIVKPGERVPLDGVIITGHSLVDTSALTGESVPRDVVIDDEVLAGFININGLLTISVTKEFKESTVVKILEMVQNASSRKAPTENFITKFSRIYTPVVVFTALAIAFLPPLLIKDAIFYDWLYRGLIFLVVSCPCALVISIPLGFFGGIGGASRSGILIKGGNYLEALNQLKTIVFDKTGTLTHGIFKVNQIVCAADSDVDKADLLYYAALAESQSNHPIARSILEEYNEPISIKTSIEYEEIPGHGVRAVIDGKNIIVGNYKLMQKNGLNPAKGTTGGTIVYVAVDDSYHGYISINDEIRTDARQMVVDLQQLGIDQLVMLTGDREEIANQVANELKIDRVFAGLLPDEKVEKVEELVETKSFSGKIAFVGDGINDAPVLARADVGIAMGGLGSDAAIEAADIVLMTDEPSKIVDAIRIARKTKRIVLENIIFSLGVKGFVLLLGALGHASMWQAVFADVGVALIAVLNSIRVIRFNSKQDNSRKLLK